MIDGTGAQDIIRVDSVSVRFGEKLAVRELTFSVKKGERVAILGRTGSGKSTVLNLLIGNFEPTSGSVRVTGLDPFRQHKQLQGRIGMAFQSPSLLPWYTALDNARVGLDIIGYPKDESRKIARAWLNRVQLVGVDDLYPNQLSGGMRQRVSLARAFAIEPEVLMLDESFSALDEVTASALRKDFRDVCEERRTTALIVTHSIEEAFYLATRVIVFGSPAQILGEYNTHDYTSPEAFRAVRDEIRVSMGTGTEEQADMFKPADTEQTKQTRTFWPKKRWLA